MAYACEHCTFSRDSVNLQIENLQRRLDETNDLLRSSQRTQTDKLRRRDKLASKLKDIEESGLQSPQKYQSFRVPRYKPRDFKTTLGPESLRSFVKWRKQLRILHDALEDAIEELLRVNTREARRAAEELQELRDDVASSLSETAEWTEDDVENIVHKNNGRGHRDLRSTKKNLRSIVHDAEDVRRLSHKLSTQMKGEVEGLKRECVAMVKDLVAMNRILEEQKRALVE